MKITITLLLSLLLFILNVPHTIALRNLIASILLITLIIIYFKNFQIFKKNKAFYLFLPLIILTIYIFFHTLYIAEDFNWSISEFKSQWIIPLIYLIIGILLALITQINNYIDKKMLINIIFFSLFFHILYIDMVALNQMLQSHTVPTRFGGFTQSPVLGNYLTNILITLIMSETIYRINTKQQILFVSNIALFVLFVLCLFSSIIEGMRFGIVSLSLISFSFIIIFLISKNTLAKKAKILFLLALVILVSLPILYNLHYDKRWGSLYETINISIDTTSNTYWRNETSEIPKLSNGKNVSLSNYLRIAWASKSIEYIAKDPLGIGFGRNAFGHSIQKYDNINNARGKHSHSSILDFTIGVGVFGLLIWILFIALLLIYSLRLFLSNNNYYALITFFITSGFFFRSVVDSNMRDHMFLQFLLTIGISFTIAIYENRKSIKN